MTSVDYKAHREQLGLTQAGLASRLQVSRKTVNARENGGRIPLEAQLAIKALSFLDGQLSKASETEI